MRLYAPRISILVNIVADRSWLMRLDIKGKGKGVVVFGRDGIKTSIVYTKSK